MVPPEADPWIGKTIEGRYVIRRRIGRGGMGVVYEAEHAALDRRVAIKVIAAKEAPEAYLTRFRREAKLASRITHEHLVHIYDVGTDLESSSEFIVMEYVEGRDLGKELDGGRLSIARTIAIARQLLQGLHAIHEGGVIHRDIKPTNVMLTARSGDRDYVKLMDFGIARAIDDVSLTATGHVVGTPNFMSPEQLRGQEVDHRTDLYAVGVTMFAMIAGKLPFEGNTAMLAGQHVFQPPPSLAKLRPETPPALIAAVERALAKAPADRFADALAFAKALEPEAMVAPAAAPASAPAAVDSREVATVSSRPPARAPARRLLLLGGLAVAAATAGVIWYVQRPTADAPPTPIGSAAPPIVRPAQVDAAVTAVVTPGVPPVDAAPDATTTSAGPDTPIDPQDGGKPPDKRPPPVGGGSDLLCHCLPTNAADQFPLCPQKGTSLCRCDTNDGASLCPTKLVIKKVCSGSEPIDCAPNGVVCTDKEYAKYHLPGRADEPCSGFAVPRWGEPNPNRVTGHLECDVCPGVPLDRFPGREGEPCGGFYWRTGEPKSGTLAHCK
ncbi:MAG: protein kinase [Myxococcales bacterium]|nr:protein kinase [Myxococcales bacterium]